MPKKLNTRRARELRSRAEFYVDGEFRGVFGTTLHDDGSITFEVPLPDHISRSLRKYGLPSAADYSDESEESDGKTVVSEFHGPVELVHHDDGTVSFDLPLSDHIGRWLDKYGPFSTADSSVEAEESDGESNAH